MTKKNKRKQPDAEEILARPWCYYCERDFDDLKILISHQKARHFKCERCGRRLNTAGGLAVHMTQVHKEQLQKVEHAIEGRESVDIEIFGMEGIPENEIAAHRQRVLSQISQAEAERRAQAGIPGTGKKSKVTAAALDPEEIKRRLEEHRRVVVDGSVTPSLTPGAHGGSASPGRSQSPAQYGAAGSPTVPAQAAYPTQGFPQHQPGFAAYPPASSFPQTGYPTTPHFQAPVPFAPQQPLQYGAPAPASTAPPYNGFGGVNRGFSGSPPNAGFPHQQSFTPPPHQQSFPHQQPQQYPQHPQPHHQPPHHPHSNNPLPKPSQVPGLPPKPNIPGLPPKPTFAANGPPAAWGQNLHGQQHHHNNTHQQPHHGGFQQTGGFGGQQGFSQQQAPQNGAAASAPIPVALAPSPIDTANVTPVGNGTSAPPNTAVANSTSASTPVPEGDAKKKDEAKTKLVYDEIELSPEEKRAMLPRYAKYTDKFKNSNASGESDSVATTTVSAIPTA